MRQNFAEQNAMAIAAAEAEQNAMAVVEDGVFAAGQNVILPADDADIGDDGTEADDDNDHHDDGDDDGGTEADDDNDHHDDGDDDGGDDDAGGGSGSGCGCGSNEETSSSGLNDDVGSSGGIYEAAGGAAAAPAAAVYSRDYVGLLSAFDTLLQGLGLAADVREALQVITSDVTHPLLPHTLTSTHPPTLSSRNITCTNHLYMYLCVIGAVGGPRSLGRAETSDGSRRASKRK